MQINNKGLSSQSYGFSNSYVWMWGLDYKESWAPKNWCFWTAVLEKTLESPLDWMESNQSILKEISPGCSLEGLMLKLKCQYFGHLIQRTDSFERTLMLGKIEVRRRRGRQRMRWLDCITDSMKRKLSKLQEIVKTGEPGMLQSMGSWRVRHSLATGQQQQTVTIREWRHRMEAEAREERGTTAGFEYGGRDHEPRNIGSLENVQKTMKWVLF